MLEAQLVGASGKLTPSQGPPSHPSADAPRSRCEASSGLGARSQLLVGRVSGVLTLLQAVIPPTHTVPVGGKQRHPSPVLTPTSQGLRALGMKLPLLGVRVSLQACVLCPGCAQGLDGSPLPCRRWCIKPPPRASSKASSQATMPLSLPMAPQVRASAPENQAPHPPPRSLSGPGWSRNQGCGRLKLPSPRAIWTQSPTPS